MPDANFDESSRGSAEIFHFAVACVGLLAAITGVVIASVCLAVFGIAVLGWGVGYFCLFSE